MGWQDINPGTKSAKVMIARFIKAKTGTMGLEVAFEFQEGENTERLNWVGWLSAGALENTMKTLVDVLGFNGNDAADASGVLTDPKALAYGSNVSLVVEMEPNQDHTKEYPRIKWVNKLGGSAFEGCAPELIKADLNAIGFRAAFLAAKQGQPSTASGKPANADGLPF